MEEKSKQQNVFDWLLKNPDVLHGSDNASLYKKFANSGLSRNRLRSYKSRLREKIEAGEIDETPPVKEKREEKIEKKKEKPQQKVAEESVAEEPEERFHLEFKFGSVFKFVVIFIGFMMIHRFFKKLFSRD